MYLLKLKHPEKFFETPALIAYLLSILIFERLNPIVLKWIGYYEIANPVHLLWMIPLALLLSIGVFCAIVIPYVWLFRMAWSILNNAAYKK